MAKVVRFHELGGPEVLRLEEIEVGEPAAGELRIRVDAIGLNRSESMLRSGHYVHGVDRFPALLGYEAAGAVEAVGDGVAGFTVGDLVSVVPAFRMGDYGVYGDQVIVPASAVVHRPAEIDAVTGAAVWMPFITAYGALVDVGGLRAGDAVVVTAASSSVGLATIQLVNHLGGIPIATTRTSAKRDQLLAAGAEHVIVTDEEDVVERVLAVTEGRGVRFVFDPVAGPGVRELAKVMAPGGTLFVYGTLSREPTPFPTTAPGRPFQMRSYTLMEITMDEQRLRRAERFIGAALRSGAFRPVIDRSFDLAEIVDAHRYLESNAQVGKIIVTVGH
ncbi:zinc-dependent alcohol dehydrogenase family protein [Solihabitans fulvus]|uniref:Zinc-dependent alcohol dehydrogenase family protein n=1 Tax=Solihabitans fulvus TaxID=1892852 RepID=A0A5B2XF94_9PSEU|nr:zinc-dependent alcohol dehydrogenase family protein [Solihabitans fulvus]KAA2261794.1 zinc-dependent alcohol dehydrogenase family protein [Solihabitans fulvus]